MVMVHSQLVYQPDGKHTLTRIFINGVIMVYTTMTTINSVAFHLVKPIPKQNHTIKKKLIIHTGSGTQQKAF
jgi:hypothetical protein